MATTSARRAVSATTTGSEPSKRRRPKLLRHAGSVALLLALAVGGAACTASEAAPAAPAGDAVLAEGREIWTKNCANCHGSAGGGGRGSKLNEGRVLDRYPEIADQLALVTDGVRAMPAFGGKLSEAELEAVVRYTREVLAEVE